MIKHLIKFNGIQLCLDKKEILSLSQAIEPYAIAIMMGIPDDQVSNFIQQHQENTRLVKETKKPKKEKIVQETVGSDIISIEKHKQKRK